MSTSAFLSLHSNFQAANARNTLFEWGRPAPGRMLLGDAEGRACCYLVWKGAVELQLCETDRWTSYHLDRGDVVCTAGLAATRFLTADGLEANSAHALSFAPLTTREDGASDSPELFRATVPLRLLPHMDGAPHLQLIRGADMPLYAGNIGLAFENVLREIAQTTPAPLIEAVITHHIKTISLNIVRARFQTFLFSCEYHASGPIIERMMRALSKALDSRRLDWTIKDLAREAGMSRTNFYNHCRQFLNASPMTLLTRARMRKAAGILLTEDISVEAAAFECGYESATTFIRAFSREFGQAPGRWRRDTLHTKPFP